MEKGWSRLMSTQGGVQSASRSALSPRSEAVDHTNRALAVDLFTASLTVKPSDG